MVFVFVSENEDGLWLLANTNGNVFKSIYKIDVLTRLNV